MCRAHSQQGLKDPCLQPSPALCLQPYLYGPAHDGSSRPSPSGGPGCPGHRAPAALSCSPSQGGSLEAGGLTGGVATGPGGRAWRGRGAAPGAAVAAMKLVVSTAEKERAGRAIPLAPSWGGRGTMPPKPLSPAQSTCCLAEGSLLMDRNLHT